MGIQVSNWNDYRVERARLDQQLASLRTELEGNLATVRNYERRIESQLSDVHLIERAFDRPSEAVADIDLKLMNVFRITSLILESSAYDELNDSGGFRYVDGNIRSAVTDWQARKRLVERVDQDALAYRQSAVDYLSGVLAFEPMARSFAPSFQPAVNAPVRNDPARLANDPRVRNFLAMRYTIETQKLRFARDLEQATVKLLAILGPSKEA